MAKCGPRHQPPKKIKRGVGSRSVNLFKSGSYPDSDPDPGQWCRLCRFFLWLSYSQSKLFLHSHICVYRYRYSHAPPPPPSSFSQLILRQCKIRIFPGRQDFAWFSSIVRLPQQTPGDERSGDERSGIRKARLQKVRPQNIRQGNFGTKRPQYITK